MRLITLAHRGEAQTFLKSGNFTAVQGFIEGLYENGRDLLLLTGEGPTPALMRVSMVLGKYHEQIHELLNFGIAGALDKKIFLNKIYSIRTSYGEDEFKSASADGEVDCITAKKRVLDNELALKLSHFAPIVDRELWGITRICSENKIPFKSFKLISDYAGEEVPCQAIKEQAQSYSDLLCEQYLSLSPSEPMSSLETSELEGFHFTTSQTRKYKSLLKSWILKTGKPEDELIKSINFESSLRPKDKTNKLLKYIEDELNPFRVQVRERLHKHTAYLNELGVSTKFHKDFETNDIALSFHVSNQAQADKLAEAIKNIPFDKINSTMQGDFDV